MASSPKAAGTAPTKKDADMIERGKYAKDPAGTATLLGVFALNPILQYGILGRGLGSGLLNKLGISTVVSGPPNTGTFLDKSGLSPYRLILLAMATGVSVKGIFWHTVIQQEELKPGPAGMIAGFATFVNAVNTLAFTTTFASASLSSNSQFPQTTLLVGGALYVVGMAIETISEIDRKRFKDSPANKGKLYTGGLWSLTRHANYFGFLLWRTGFSIAASGWTLGALSAASLLSVFLGSSVPEIEDYTSKRYGVQWQEYERKTPYKLIPFVV